ncbi:hypothetical protein Tcan_07025, partial [Toxocara canis]
ISRTSDCYDLSADCSTRKEDCLKPANFSTMFESCKKTCGMCSESFVCKDVASDCAHYIDLCNDPAYEGLQKYCRSSCGLCNSPVCYDNIPTCNETFCNSPNYTNEQKKDNCAKTCNLC